MSMKSSIIKMNVLPCIIAFFLFTQLSVCAKEKNSENGKIDLKLDVGLFYDQRLPKIEKQDIIEMFEEANKVLKNKLGTPLTMSIGKVREDSFSNLFTNKYHNDEFKNSEKHRYHPSMDKNSFDKLVKQSKSHTVNFMKNWKLSSYQNYFPGKNIKNYDEAHTLLMQTMYSKGQFLSQLKTNSGTALLSKTLKPWQSGMEWNWAVFNQNKYDLFITNALIVCDDVRAPYLHAVTKHGKIGGSGFDSPKRRALNGKSVMINTIEFLGEIDGLSVRDKKLTRSFKNKAIGGFFLAHEIGHVYYFIPDQYDHGAHCLMNSAYEDMDYIEGYRKLKSSKGMCQKCKPWVNARHEMNKLRGVKVTDANRVDWIINMLELIDDYPEKLSTNREYYLSNRINKVAGESLKIVKDNPDYYLYCLKIAVNQKLHVFLESEMKLQGWNKEQLNSVLSDLE